MREDERTNAYLSTIGTRATMDTRITGSLEICRVKVRVGIRVKVRIRVRVRVRIRGRGRVRGGEKDFLT